VPIAAGDVAERPHGEGGLVRRGHRVLLLHDGCAAWGLLFAQVFAVAKSYLVSIPPPPFRCLPSIDTNGFL
jgi:hypothetical protein